MTVLHYSLVPAPVRPGWPQLWRLLDANGKWRGEMSDPAFAPDMIAAFELAAIIAENCAKVGQLVEEAARYQCVEDEFNDDLFDAII